MPIVYDEESGGLAVTQDPGHGGSHAACDGNGRILARWPLNATGSAATARSMTMADTDPSAILFCGEKWPNLGPAGGLWTCTLDVGHDGDHEARGPGGRRLYSSPSSTIPQGDEEILDASDA